MFTISSQNDETMILFVLMDERWRTDENNVPNTEWENSVIESDSDENVEQVGPTRPRFSGGVKFLTLSMGSPLDRRPYD